MDLVANWVAGVQGVLGVNGTCNSARECERGRVRQTVSLTGCWRVACARVSCACPNRKHINKAS